MLTTEQKIANLKRAIERSEENYRRNSVSRVRSSSASFDLEMDWAALQRLRSELAELEAEQN